MKARAPSLMARARGGVAVAGQHHHGGGGELGDQGKAIFASQVRVQHHHLGVKPSGSALCLGACGGVADGPYGQWRAVDQTS